MSDIVEESSDSEHSDNSYGVILGYWDHEKTPSLIRDLEYSVNSVEEKCKNLLEELIYYKNYLENSSNRQPNRPNEKGKKNNQKPCESDTDVSFRKKLLSDQQLAQVFEQKFQEKLCDINEELTAAADKIGLKDNIVLFPSDDYLKTIQSETKQQIQKTWSSICQEFLKMNYFMSKTNSADNLIAQEHAEITKTEFEIYKKLSKLSVKKKKKKRKKEGRRVKFACVKKPLPKLDDASKERRRRKRRRRKYIIRGKIKMPSRASDIQIMCKSLAEAMQRKSLEKQQEEQGESSTLGSVVRKAVPFTTCKSTTKSHNIGMNVQQFLSQTKYEKTREPGKKKSSGGEREQMEWSRPSTFSGEGDVWISEHHTSNVRKFQTKYTGCPSEAFVEYHKSTMSQYTNGQKSMIKAESKTAYAVGSKIMVSDCKRMDYYQIDKDRAYHESGDGGSNKARDKLNMDWSKVNGAFLDVYKKYIELKKKITDSNCGLQDNELEIEKAMKKYKDFLQFYNRFLQLKHRLKSLKIASETKMIDPMTSFEKRMVASKKAYPAAMKKALREIQHLQEKIKLIRDH